MTRYRSEPCLKFVLLLLTWVSTLILHGCGESKDSDGNGVARWGKAPREMCPMYKDPANVWKRNFTKDRKSHEWCKGKCSNDSMCMGYRYDLVTSRCNLCDSIDHLDPNAHSKLYRSDHYDINDLSGNMRDRRNRPYPGTTRETGPIQGPRIRTTTRISLYTKICYHDKDCPAGKQCVGRKGGNVCVNYTWESIKERRCRSYLPQPFSNIIATKSHLVQAQCQILCLRNSKCMGYVFEHPWLPSAGVNGGHVPPLKMAHGYCRLCDTVEELQPSSVTRIRGYMPFVHFKPGRCVKHGMFYVGATSAMACKDKGGHGFQPCPPGTQWDGAGCAETP